MHPFDLHHQYVCIVGANVVLQQQTDAVACRRGVKSRVVELEPAGSIDSPHEGRHARTIDVVQLPHMGTVDGFVGQLGRQTVECLVKIYHQEVQAVLGIPLSAGQADVTRKSSPKRRMTPPAFMVCEHRQ